MRHLVVLDGYNAGMVYDITGDAVVLGRDPECDIHLMDDQTSRRHVRIAVGAGECELADLDSRNGTYVNGILCRRRTLKHGDEISVGSTVLLYIHEEESRATGDEVDEFLSQPERDTETRFNIYPSLLRQGKGLEAIRMPESSVIDAGGVTLVGDSPPMRALSELILRAAPTGATVLITGESGTGKELVARATHRNSHRRRGPFIVLNCAALSEHLLGSELFGHEKGAFTGAATRRLSRFELAHEGTLFLDEIGEIGPEAQAKLLRVIETGEFQRIGGNEVLRSSARVVAATNRDLARDVDEGRFRQDLYYRLRVIEIRVPPLRERATDIPALAEFFLELFTRQSGMPRKRIAADTMDALVRHTWPGNVRELRNSLERMYFLSPVDALRVEDLPADLTDKVPPRQDAQEVLPLRDVERRHILAALEATGWNKGQASALLGIDRKTLYAKLKSYNIEDPRASTRRMPPST